MQTRKTKLTFNFGFTLLELLVVMAILGILSTIGIGSFLSSQVKSRDAKRKSDLHNIVAALEMYYNDKGQYPTSSTTGTINGCTYDAINKVYGSCEWGEEFKTSDNGVVYMSQLPRDPSSNNYVYKSDVNGTYFILYTRLENENDNDVQQGPNKLGYDATVCDPNPNPSDPKPQCNYAVASANATLPELK